MNFEEISNIKMEVNIKFFEIIIGAFIMVVDNDTIYRNAIQIFDMKGKLYSKLDINENVEDKILNFCLIKQ